VLWEGSIILAKIIEDMSEELQLSQNVRVLELGAGLCGLPGHVAATYGANVIVTDIEDMLPQLFRNVKSTLWPITAACFNWSSDCDEVMKALQQFGSIDLVLCADCIYSETYESLYSVVKCIFDLNPKTVILMSNANRREVFMFKKRLVVQGILVEDVKSEYLNSTSASECYKCWKISKFY
jgi:predicted nicotinamide N-methyase